MRRSLLACMVIVAMLFTGGFMRPGQGAMKFVLKFENKSDANVKLTVHDVVWDTLCVRPRHTFTKDYDAQPKLVVADFHENQYCLGSVLYYKAIAGFHSGGYVANGVKGKYSFHGY
jgi:hypothetical protein